MLLLRLRKDWTQKRFHRSLRWLPQRFQEQILLQDQSLRLPLQRLRKDWTQKRFRHSSRWLPQRFQEQIRLQDQSLRLLLLRLHTQHSREQARQTVQTRLQGSQILHSRLRVRSLRQTLPQLHKRWTQKLFHRSLHLLQ